MSAPEDLFPDSPLSRGGIRTGETPFEHFARSDRPEAIAARNKLNRYWKRVPPASREPLYERLSASDEPQFEAAVFELHMHDLFLSSDFDIEVQPTISDDRTPDFCVRFGNKEPYTVECTVIRESQASAKLSKRVHQLNMEASPKITVPGYVVSFGHSRSRIARNNPSATKFAVFLNNWFKEADNGPNVHGTRVYDEGPLGWKLCLTLIPLGANRLPAQVIALQSTGAWTGDTGADKLRSTIKRKLKRYHDCERLVVAIAYNDFANLPDDDEIRLLLYGHAEGRRQDKTHQGIWASATSTAGERLSGVIIFRGCYPSGLDEAAPVLWDNPHAREEILLDPWSFPRICLKQH